MGAFYIRNRRRISAGILLAVAAAVILTISAAADEFPAGSTFNGMQITYSISGVSIESSTDVEDFTTSRTLTGTVTGKTVSITATVKQDNGFSASISAGCGGKSYSKEIQVGESDSFSLSVPVTKDMEYVSVSVNMTGFYNAGTRGLVVEGTFKNPNYKESSVTSGTSDTPDDTGSYYDPQLDFLNVPGPDDMGQLLTGVIVPGLLSSLLALLASMGYTGPDNPLTSLMGGGFTDGATHVLTSLDGKTYTLHYNAAAGGWCYENGMPFSADGWNEAQRQITASNKFQEREREKIANRDTAFDREMDKMVQDQKAAAMLASEKAKILRNLRNMEDAVLFGNSPEARSLYENRGGPGDIMESIRKLKLQLANGADFKEISKAYEKIRKVYGDRISGDTAGYDSIPSGVEIWGDTVSQFTSNYVREIATSSSYKALAVRVLTGFLTGGASEFGFTGANALYNMKDYVDAGGDSVLEAWKAQTVEVIQSEIMGRFIGKTVGVTTAGGKKLLGKVVDVDAITKSSKKAIEDVVEQIKVKLKDIKKTTIDNPVDDIISKAKEAVAKDSKLTTRSEYFRKGEEIGARKVADLDEARRKLAANPDSAEAADAFNKAVEDVQMDKFAMKKLNAAKGTDADSVRKAFNTRMASHYDESIEKTRIRIAQEYGVKPEQVDVVLATNKPVASTGTAASSAAVKKAADASDNIVVDAMAKGRKMTTLPNTEVKGYVAKSADELNVSSTKASIDKDVTFRIEQTTIDTKTGAKVKGFVDVPKADTERIYNQEFYKAGHGGKLPSDMKDVKRYAEKMDQTATDRLDPEAFGTGNKDLKIATDHTGDKFSDVGAVAKTMEYKATHWSNKADATRNMAKDAAASGDYAEAARLASEAEGFAMEGMRQTTKQFNGMVVNRVIKANEAAVRTGAPLVKIPTELQKGIEVMKKVETGQISVAEAEKALELMNMTPAKVSEMSSAVLESLQKFGN